MRKVICFLLLVIVCSCGGDENISINKNNNVAPNPPNLVAPSNNNIILIKSIDAPIYFEWTKANDPDDDITSYEFHIAENPYFNNGSYFNTSSGNETNTYLNSNQYSTPRPNIEADKTYYWKVRARDSKGNISSFSSTWSFSTKDGAIPTKPKLIYPLNRTKCSNNKLTFKWNASTTPSNGKIKYKLHISKSPNFNSNVETYMTSATEYSTTLPTGTALYWKVEAFNSQSTVSSSVRSLYTQGKGTKNTMPYLKYLSPKNNSRVSNPIILKWEGSDKETKKDELHYKVFLSKQGETLKLIQEGNTAIKALSQLSSGVNYQWVVYVTDKDGATNVGRIQSFKVD